MLGKLKLTHRVIYQVREIRKRADRNEEVRS